MELLADERMAGHQHFGFKLSTDANGYRVFGCDANGILIFELAQIRVGPGTVPISIVLYIYATYIKQGIPILPIYSEYCCDIKYDIIYDIMYDIVCDVISSMILAFDQWLA
jgi:hypothetical protein